MKPLHCLVLLAAASSVCAQDSGLARCRAIANGAARLSCYDALPLGAAAPAAVQQTPEAFGCEANETAPRLDAIESRISGPFEGWSGRTLFKLDNGQVWQVSDGSSAALNLKDRQVRIRRGMFGAFCMEVAGTNRFVRARRVQ